MTEKLVEVTDLLKKYNSLNAVDGITFHIDAGEVFGLLGPNGAGKTTTIEIMEGLRKSDGGRVRINGFDPQKNNSALKQIMGVQLQSSALEEMIKPWEALKLFGSYYRKSASVDYLLELVGLEEKKNTYYKYLSGGQKQRLSLALALVNDPQMVFLDEPTTGLDAQARRTIWGIITGLKKDGRTVLLTTHYIEEAENLCDRVAIVDHGKIIAEGSPREMIDSSGITHRISFSTKQAVDSKVLELLSAKYGKITLQEDMYHLQTDQSGQPVVDIIKALESSNNELIDLRLERPTLEDVFIELTGRRIRE